MLPRPHPSRFRWHPDARAFAGQEEITQGIDHKGGHIRADPPALALKSLYSKLGQGTAFCVSERAPPDLDTLTGGQFATLTGGTSGTPKTILRSQGSWITSFETNAAQFDYSFGDSITVLGALSHSLALYGVIEGLHLGLTVHALSPLKPSAQSTRMQQVRCTILYATPTQLRLLPASISLPDIRLVLCGGGSLSAGSCQHVAEICPNAAIHVFYGAAETSFITLSDADTPESSVGKAYPQVEITVREPDATGTGTLWVRSPYLFERYLQGNSPHTQRDGDWLTLGEIGRLDADGNLYLRGRAGRVFNIADQTVYPEEIEAALLSRGTITQCTALARPDPLRGAALILAVEGPDSPQARASILDHCKALDMIPPREIFFLDRFPTLPSGKPDLLRIATLTGCAP